MKTGIKGINYYSKQRKYYVRKNNIYVGQYFTLHEAKQALEKFIRSYNELFSDIL